MGQGAYIFGCAGPALDASERDFFRDADPWGFILFARNIETPEQVLRLCDSLRDAVGRNAPILIDQEGGRVQRMGPPHWRQWPPPLEQAGMEEAERGLWLRGRMIAEELRHVGIDVNCGPTLDIARPNTHPFLRNRCFGEDAASVVTAATAFAAGLQAGGVLGVPKHMPGHGTASVDSHFELPSTELSLPELEANDFLPFRAFATAALGMTAHVVYRAIDPEKPATTSNLCIDYIRQEIGFTGLLMTDDISMNALGGTVEDRGKAALRAGCDLVLHCNGDLSEMKNMAAACGPMSAEAQQRAERALASRTMPEPFDAAAAEAELAELVEAEHA